MTATAANFKVAILSCPMPDWIQRLNQPCVGQEWLKLSKTNFSGHGSSRLAAPSPRTAKIPITSALEWGCSSPISPGQRRHSSFDGSVMIPRVLPFSGPSSVASAIVIFAENLLPKICSDRMDLIPVPRELRLTFSMRLILPVDSLEILARHEFLKEMESYART